jgi:16S rRNA (guanine527-N7)-methyltransferase
LRAGDGAGDGRAGAIVSRIAEAVIEAGLAPLTDEVAERFAVYFELLVRWNGKLNLTAIREPGEIMQRHFVECIFCAQRLPAGIETLLDYGSGGGFPGIPIALCRPEIRVTLAESQGKKAAFLREAVRTAGISATVYGGRVEDLPTEVVFDAVALRAVDRMKVAIRDAAGRVRAGGWLVLLTATGESADPEIFRWERFGIPGGERRVVLLGSKLDVPRGTSA